MVKPLYVLGAGGHAGVLIDILKSHSVSITATFSPSTDRTRDVFSDIENLDNDDVLLAQNCGDFDLVNGIGSLPGCFLRQAIYKKFAQRGFEFQQVVSKYAIISPYAVLGSGVQVMAGAIVQAGAVIGDNSIINTGAIVEHDCIIGQHNHIAPGATLSGSVHTGDCVHIGTGATVIQNISIGPNSIIAAGAIITKSIEKEKIVFGARANIQDKRTSNEL